ncbi:unnamed protein product [Protopolystoma xenopodis]|uniref:Uncharacterized protein n=1 Tax=Protopolystoma xenopodis TaxID=117903 RepID=A0A3S5BX96_9PLAT|nr:unnamed protein product [Protopolystoma xenopodis]
MVLCGHIRTTTSRLPSLLPLLRHPIELSTYSSLQLPSLGDQRSASDCSYAAISDTKVIPGEADLINGSGKAKSPIIHGPPIQLLSCPSSFSSSLISGCDVSFPPTSVAVPGTSFPQRASTSKEPLNPLTLTPKPGSPARVSMADAPALASTHYSECIKNAVCHDCRLNLPRPQLDAEQFAEADRDCLAEVVLRCAGLGWETRRDFEQTWMAYLSVLYSRSAALLSSAIMVASAQASGQTELQVSSEVSTLLALRIYNGVSLTWSRKCLLQRILSFFIH